MITVPIELTESECRRIYSALRTALDWCYVNRSEEIKAKAAAETDTIIRKLLKARKELNEQSQSSKGKANASISTGTIGEDTGQAEGNKGSEKV